MSSAAIHPLDDEWWTTAMVCSYLKLKRRALWDIRRDPQKAFPLAVKPGGKVNLFRADDVRTWVAKRAPRPLPPPQPPAIKAEPKRFLAPAPKSETPKPVIIQPKPAPKPQRRQAQADARQLGLF